MDTFKYIEISISYNVPPAWVSLAERTAYNRYMVFHKKHITGYLAIEDMVKRNKKLPENFNYGYVPGAIV